MWTTISILGTVKVVTPFVSGVLERSEQQMDCCKCVVVIGSTILYSLDQAKRNMLPTDSMLCVQSYAIQYKLPDMNTVVKMKCSAFVGNFDDTVCDCDCIILQDVHLNLSLAPGDKITSTLQWRLCVTEPNRHLSDTQMWVLQPW